MELKIQREWLARMAEKEANGIISVGGLVASLKRPPKSRPSTQPNGRLSHNWCSGSGGSFDSLSKLSPKRRMSNSKKS